jgi:hypothetical protein
VESAENISGRDGDSTSEIDASEKALRSRLDWVLVAILAVTSLCAAWSGYEAARWSGIQSSEYSRASANQSEANLETSRGYLAALEDESHFSGWANAYISGNDELATFFQQRFSPEYETAFNAWIATSPRTNPDAPASPMQMPEYVNPAIDHAEALTEESHAAFERGDQANERSDAHVLNTVIFASVLFFAGFASRIRAVKGQFVIEVIAIVVLLIGLYQIITIPTA